MKNLILSTLTILLLFGISVEAQTTAKSKSLKSSFQTLGDNEEVIDRVQKLDNQQRIRVVQNRMMDRNNRLEAALNFGMASGADSYVGTKNFGGMLQYHITPRWSLGVSYEKGYNTLTPEGTRIYDSVAACQAADASCTLKHPSIDFPLDTKLVSVSFYPIYGKLNLFDSGIAQFDMYTSVGYGQKSLASGDTNVIAGSLGVGVWINSFVTARLEGRYENYKDLLKTEKRNQNAVTVVASLGAMLW